MNKLSNSLYELTPTETVQALTTHYTGYTSVKGAYSKPSTVKVEIEHDLLRRADEAVHRGEPIYPKNRVPGFECNVNNEASYSYRVTSRNCFKFTVSILYMDTLGADSPYYEIELITKNRIKWLCLDAETVEAFYRVNPECRYRQLFYREVVNPLTA